jgi:hypothetical protein
VALSRYLPAGGLELAKEEIEVQSQIQLPYTPRWLKPISTLEEGNTQRSTLVVTIRDKQLANKLIQTGLYFGGTRHIVEKYWESGKGEICPRCCKFGHYEGCTEEAKCYLCAGPHLAGDHVCPVEGCNMKDPCKHLPPKCANCQGKHFATSVKCPKKWENIRQSREAERPRPKTPERPKTPQGIQSSPPKEATVSRESMALDEFSLPTMSSFPNMSSIQVTPTPIGRKSQTNLWE